MLYPEGDNKNMTARAYAAEHTQADANAWYWLFELLQQAFS